MLGAVLSWNGPAGTLPLYCFTPLTYSSTSEGSAAWPRNCGSGAVIAVRLQGEVARDLHAADAGGA